MLLIFFLSFSYELLLDSCTYCSKVKINTHPHVHMMISHLNVIKSNPITHTSPLADNFTHIYKHCMLMNDNDNNIMCTPLHGICSLHGHVLNIILLFKYSKVFNIHFGSPLFTVPYQHCRCKHSGQQLLVSHSAVRQSHGPVLNTATCNAVTGQLCSRSSTQLPKNHRHHYCMLVNITCF